MQFGRTLLLALGLAAFTSGCGPSSPPEPPSIEQAEALLTEFLELWRAGQPFSELESHQPPIRAVEAEWSGGSTLLNYRVKPSGSPTGNSRSFPVVLSIKDNKGRKRSFEVLYFVTPGDPILIARE